MNALADFSTMEYKLDNNIYTSLDDLVEDARLVFSNCRTYNHDSSVYAKNAIRMEKFLDEWLDDPTRD
jgi:histone acetyltransferase